MSQIDLPEEILNKMSCSTCNNHLSLYPVYVKKDGTGAVCGRCKPKEESQYIRDESYEILAQFLVFPCIYKENGCLKKLVPNLLEDHETYCEFKKFGCPSSVYTNCNWGGPKNLVFQHFNEKHKSLIIEEQTFEFDFHNSIEKILVMKVDDEIFVVKNEIDARKEMFICSVEHLKSKDGDDHYTYFVRIESNDRNYFHKCHEKATDGEEQTKLFSKEFKEKLHDPPSMFAKIVVKKVSGSQDVPSKIEEQQKPNVEWELLSELECPVCYEYMLPPIYQCATGHSLCKNCKPKIPNNACPTCKEPVGSKQNFALEKLTQFITYPCKYYRKGCQFTCKSTQMEAHEACCDFGSFYCPLKVEKQCVWTNPASDILEHVQNVHSESVLKNDRIEMGFDFDQSNSETYLLVHNKKVFKLSYNFSNNICQWTMKIMGTLAESRLYKFQISIFDTTGNKNHLAISGSVIPYTAATINAKNCIKLSGDTLQALIDDKLVYVVKILEK